MLLSRLFRRRKSLRDLCVEEYGEWYGELYDELAHGRPIGDFNESLAFLAMLDRVREKHRDELTR